MKKIIFTLILAALPVTVNAKEKSEIIPLHDCYEKEVTVGDKVISKECHVGGNSIKEAKLCAKGLGVDKK